MDRGVYKCVSECPNITRIIDLSTARCAYDTNPSTDDDYVNAVIDGLCAGYELKSTPLLNRCIPSDFIPSNFNITSNSTASESTLETIMTTGRSLRVQAMADLTVTWPLVNCC